MLKKWIKEYILKNKYDLVVILIMLLIGGVIGIGIFAFLDGAAKEVLIKKAIEVFELTTSKEYLETNVVINGIKTNIILTCILAFSSVTLFGRYIIEMMSVIKGAMLSIYTLILFNVFGFGNGILAVLLLVILVNLIYIPVYVFMSVLFMEVHFNIFKTKINGISLLEIFRYIGKLIIFLVIMFSSTIVEQVASLVVLKMFLKTS